MRHPFEKKWSFVRHRIPQVSVAFFVLGSGLLVGLFSGSAFFLSARAVAQPEATLASEERCRVKTDVEEFRALRAGEKPMFQKEDLCQPESLALEIRDTEKEKLEEAIRSLASGYPLERMAKAIAAYDTEIAGLIVGIAKKESDWGKHVPLAADGSDCFNYWGYKGAGVRGTAMGHGCFGTPEEAVAAIGNRLVELSEKRQSTEPRRMIVWKCGSSCDGHSDESVAKWISDVNRYYQKIISD